MPDFTHLHVHSGYSLLDGLGRIPDLVAAAKAEGMDALALTDHGTAAGLVEFYGACQDAEIKPILGVEAYVTTRSLSDKPERGDQNYHLVLLAENTAGYHNLLKLLSIGNTHGFYYRPRIDHEVLLQHSDGLICTAACAGSEVNSALVAGDYDHARQVAGWYADVFPGRYYLELQEHGLDFDQAINDGNIRLARDLGLPLIATNDVHYTKRAYAATHEVLLCIQTQTTMQNEKRMRMATDQFYFRSAAEMDALFGHIPGALANTRAIAERCHVHLDDTIHLPKTQANATIMLRELAEIGFVARYPEDDGTARARLEYELDVVGRMGFADYYLLVHDIMSWAQRQGIGVGPGRGSAAGSIIAYCLFLTHIDPIKWSLAFERFLNPERVTMPDMDLDFEDARRDEVIAYARQKYGADRVAQIITFGTIGARAGIRDVARALGKPLDLANRLAKMVPVRPGTKLADALVLPDFARELETNPDAREIVEHVAVLEGIPRHASTHAAGVVISPDDLTEHVPLTKAPRSSNIVTGYDMGSLEKVGMLKLDFLGLRTISIIKRTCDFIAQRHGVTISPNAIDLEHPSIYKILSSGRTMGLFQVESDGMTRLLRELRPDCFEHIIAVVALYRPGPMQNIDDFVRGRHGGPVSYIHPALEEVLAPTYGIFVYQEQVMKLFSLVAGYSMGEADLVRRAMGKKKAAEMAKHHGEFLRRAEERGTPPEVAAQLWDIVEPFAGYAFNRSHAAAYAVLTAQTAFLKANFPAEFIAGMLSAERENADQVQLALAEAKRMGVPVLTPDVNHSEMDFVLTEKGIRIGLVSIKNIGQGDAEAIAAHKPYRNLPELVSETGVNKRVLKALLDAGALDGLGKRGDLAARFDRLVDTGVRLRSYALAGQTFLGATPIMAMTG